MRYDDWPTRLINALAAAKKTTFAWGTHDCVLFSADVVHAMTGVDHAAGYRGTYTTARGAYKIMRETSPDGSTTGLVDKLYKRVPVNFARRGDVVAMKTEHGSALGICGGGGANFVIESGLVSYPMSTCFTAWRVV